jgi:hypothetical protein
MKLHVIVDELDKLCKIQLLENYKLAVANLISINNLYFLDIIEDPLLQANATIKKFNYRQRQNSVKFIKI